MSFGMISNGFFYWPKLWKLLFEITECESCLWCCHQGGSPAAKTEEEKEETRAKGLRYIVIAKRIPNLKILLTRNCLIVTALCLRSAPVVKEAAKQLWYSLKLTRLAELFIKNSNLSACCFLVRFWFVVYRLFTVSSITFALLFP